MMKGGGAGCAQQLFDPLKRTPECHARTHTLLPFTAAAAAGAAADDASRALQNLHPNSPHPEKKTLLRVTSAAAAAVAVAFTDTVSRDALALSSFGSFYSLPRNHPVVNHHLKVIKPPLLVCVCVFDPLLLLFSPLRRCSVKVDNDDDDADDAGYTLYGDAHSGWTEIAAVSGALSCIPQRERERGRGIYIFHREHTEEENATVSPFPSFIPFLSGTYRRILFTEIVHATLWIKPTVGGRTSGISLSLSLYIVSLRLVPQHIAIEKTWPTANE